MDGSVYVSRVTTNTLIARPSIVCAEHNSGFGIRGTPLFTTFFERLVNTIHEKSPKSKLLFNNGPSGTFEAVRRWFP